MTRYLTRDRIAIVAALAVPLAVAAVLLPFRASWSNANVASAAGRGRSRGGGDREPRRGRRGGGVGGAMVRFLLHRAVLPVHDPQLG
jgi:hypothetical protein